MLNLLNMIHFIKAFLQQEDGAETLEYVVIVAIIIIVGAAAYNAGMPGVISTAFTAITTAIGTATG